MVAVGYRVGGQPTLDGVVEPHDQEWLDVTRPAATRSSAANLAALRARPSRRGAARGADQPGRARHRADAASRGRRRRGARTTCGGILARLAALAAEHRDTPMLGPDPDPAGAPDHVRRQGRHVAYGVLEARSTCEGCSVPGAVRRVRSASRLGRPARPSWPSGSGWQDAAALAHHAPAGHPGRRCARRGHRCVRPASPADVLVLWPARDRRAQRGGGRRLVLDAAQARTRCSPSWSAGPR